MSFNFDGTGIDPDSKGTNRVLAKGWYDFEIVSFVSKAGDTYPKEGRTKNNDPMVSILCEVINNAEFEGERVFHTVIFLKPGTPGSGMSIHFLKTIGQAFEGQFVVDSSQWVGEQFSGYVVQDEYKGKTKNKITEIRAISDVQAAAKEKANADLF